MEERRLRGEVACSGVNPGLLTPGLRADLLLRVDTEGGWLMLFPLGKRMGTICWLIKA